MRLGDLDALKEKVALMWGDNNHITESIYDIIDNAPTVEAYIEEQVKELVELNKKLSEERPQGDLISRDALKKHIAEVFEIEEKIDKKWAMGLKYSLKLIDNAPAVNTFTTRDLEDAYIRGRDPKILQGEWIDHSEDCGYVECPVCGHLTNCEDNIDELHYCWNCGSRIGKVESDVGDKEE